MELDIEIIDFWFGDMDHYGIPPEATRKRWFEKSAAFDEELKKKYGHLVEQASQGLLDGWANQPEGALAVVLLLDQFRRNIFRNTPEAFRLDPSALAIARTAIDQHYDQALLPIQRVFMYLPFEHSEDPKVQQRSIELFDALYRSVPAEQKELFKDFYKYAKAHQDVIEKFGRFPHRNAILGRESTPEELQYLADGGGF